MNGIQIKRITLFVFGGMAQMEHEPGRWPAELWMAIVGPITGLVIGFLCVLAGSSGVSAGATAQASNVADLQRLLANLDPGRTLLLWLGQINIVLAVFNLVPAFPLDGGRVLRAILWGATHDLRRATRWASDILRWLALHGSPKFPPSRGDRLRSARSTCIVAQLSDALAVIAAVRALQSAKSTRPAENTMCGRRSG